jgi:ABC-type glycerol-3-phosphate transport system substrate-binding protein
MSYKSKIATSILALAGLAMVAGCGENSSSVKSTVSSEPATTSSTPATSSSSAPEVLPTKDLAADITFWHTIGKANLDVLNTMITEFNKVYPNIHITTTSQGGYDQLKDTISNAIPAGTTADNGLLLSGPRRRIFGRRCGHEDGQLHQQHLYGLGVDNGLGDSAKSDFIQTYWNEGNQYTVDGVAKVEGLLQLTVLQIDRTLFYNKTAFDKNGWTVPTTWDEMWALCQQIKGTAGYENVNPLGYDSDANWYITLSEQKNIDYTTGVGKDHFLFNNADAKAMVTDLKPNTMPAIQDPSHLGQWHLHLDQVHRGRSLNVRRLDRWHHLQLHRKLHDWRCGAPAGRPQ